MSAIFTLRDAVTDARNNLANGSYLGSLQPHEISLIERELLVGELAERAVTSFAQVEVTRLRQAMEDRGAPAKKLTIGLTKLFRREVALGRVPPAANPMATIPRVRPSQSRLVTSRQKQANVLCMPGREELTLMLSAPNTWNGTALKLIVMTGIRLGELRALQGKHIIAHEPDPLDPNDKPAVLIDIKKAFKARLSDRDEQTPWGPIGPPKTTAGFRAIPFDQTQVDLVPEHLDPQAYIASPNGRPIHAQRLRNAIYDIQVGLGIGQSFMRDGERRYDGVYAPHQIRHGFVAQLIAAGEDDERIMRLAGHAEIGVTMQTYGYLFDRRRFGLHS